MSAAIPGRSTDAVLHCASCVRAGAHCLADNPDIGGGRCSRGGIYDIFSSVRINGDFFELDDVCLVSQYQNLLSYGLNPLHTLRRESSGHRPCTQSK